MGQKYTTEMHEAYRKEQDERAAKAEEGRRERAERAAALQAWKAEGGSENDFRREWPKLRDEGRRQRVLDADKHAREMQRAHGPSQI